MFVSQKSDMDCSKMHASLEAANSAVYIEDYMDFVENIPDDIQRNITQLKELDLKYKEILQDIENFENAMKKDMDSLSRKRAILQIQRSLIQSQELGDKKLQIVQAIQDIIDFKSRQLEVDRKKLDTGRENETHHETVKSEPIERTTKRSRRSRHADIQLRDDIIHDHHEKEIPTPPAPKTKKKKKRKAKADKDYDLPTVDPPIDPDEPTYCLCDQVSFGEMICCDNSQCDREWFHFSCVGLITKPKGKWYCPTCRGDRSNQMKMIKT